LFTSNSADSTDPTDLVDPTETGVKPKLSTDDLQNVQEYLFPKYLPLSFWPVSCLSPTERARERLKKPPRHSDI
jgi:hypothetical protein